MVTARRPAFDEETNFWLWFDALSKVLTARQREALILRYQADLQNSDIASIMNVSESGVRSLISRGLQILGSHPELRP
jgi:RNA polymerase sigma factor (sigma-70 family)